MTYFLPKEERSRIPDVGQVLTNFDMGQRDQRNKVLILLKDLRIGGPPIEGLASLIGCLAKNYTVARSPIVDDVNVRNAHHNKVMVSAEYAATYITEYKTDHLFDVGDSENFNAIRNDPDFVELLRVVLEQHKATSAIKSSGNSDKRNDYLDICDKVDELKNRSYNLTAFDEPLTAREIAMIEKFDSKDNQSDGELESHYQNENAVCYISLALDIVTAFFLTIPAGNELPINMVKSVVETLFAVVHHKCHESAAKLKANVAKGNLGMLYGVDLGAFWSTYLSSDHFACDDNSQRITMNTILTVPRLLRLTTMITGMPSVWGISIFFDKQMLPVLLELAKFEEKLGNTRAPVSHSIAWYLVLGKDKIYNPLTDDQDQNAEATIGNLINVSHRATRRRPNAVPYVRGASSDCAFLLVTGNKTKKKA